MKFKYISKTDDAPKKTTIFGYNFELDGKAIEVKEEGFIAKLQGMKHIGIVAVKETSNTKPKTDDVIEKKDASNS